MHKNVNKGEMRNYAMLQNMLFTSFAYYRGIPSMDSILRCLTSKKYHSVYDPPMEKMFSFSFPVMQFLIIVVQLTRGVTIGYRLF